ncbi:hypothetical protein P7C70_g5698, partial [Phenoliferia sp. Uapishka_3]
MTSTASPPPLIPAPHSNIKQSPKRPDGTQRRLFRSISRFLSGGKNRPKLPINGNNARPSQVSPTSPDLSGRSPALSNTTDDSENAVPLRDVRSNSASTRSGRAQSASTSTSGLDDDDDDDSERVARNGGQGGGGGYDGASGYSGADTDASLRPISPTSLAPSSIASHSHTNSTSNASYAPTHRTFKSYASTKPTTLLSIDSGGGANRIAVVPGTGSTLPSQSQSQPNSGLPTSTSFGSLSPPGSANAITFATSPPSSPITLP